MKRKISAFLIGPKGQRTQSEKAEIFESSNGRSFVICILEGGVDEESGEITAETVYPLGLPEEHLKKVRVGMTVAYTEQS